MTFKRIIFPVVAFSMLFAACKQDENVDAAVVQPTTFYPLKVGSWFVYDVDSISYNDFTNPVTIDTITYQVREAYTDTFYDVSGNLNFELTRSKRAGNDTVEVSSMPWEVSDVWFVTAAEDRIERVEENIRFVSLSGPVIAGKTWDGNAFNFRDEWEFTYVNMNAAYEQFPNTVEVNQQQDDNFVNYKDFTEVYAKDVGLVYRKRIDVESQDFSDLSIPVIDRAQKGSQYLQRLNAYFIPE